VDWAEEKTKAYLESLTLGDVLEFSNGKNNAPDFSVGGRIGVEVTRLVHLIQIDEQTINLTQIDPNFQNAFENAVNSVDSAAFEGSYFVSVTYRLPYDPRTGGKLLRKRLQQLAQHNSIPPERFELDDYISVRLMKGSEGYERPFLWAGANNVQSAGVVIDQLLKQSRSAIERKTSSISKISEQFPEWWLAVASNLTVRMPEVYLAELAKELNSPGVFDRLVLVNWYAPNRSKSIQLR
jgi:hypothetical protein